MSNQPICELCGEHPATQCDDCARVAWEQEREDYCHDMGTLWNAVFPKEERDDWDYPDQMLRLILAQILYLRSKLELRNIDLPRSGIAPYVEIADYEPKKD